MKANCIILTETWHCENEWNIVKSFLPKYQYYHHPATREFNRGRPKGGIIIGVEIGHGIQLEKIENNNGILQIEINNEKISLLTTYISPDKENEDEYITFLDKVDETSLDNNFIIMADLNSRISDYAHPLQEELDIEGRNSEDKVINQRGRTFISRANGGSWFVINGSSKSNKNGNYTFCNTNGASVIDLCVCNTNISHLVEDFKVLTSTSSCHHPIVLSLKNNVPSTPPSQVETLQKIKWDPQKKQQFVCSFTNKQNSNPTTRSTWKTINKNILETAQECEIIKKCPVVPIQKIHKANWFDDECKQAKTDIHHQVKLLRSNYNHQPRSIILKNLQETKKKFQLLKKEKKNIQSETTIKSITQASNSQTFWKEIKKFRRRPTEPPPKISKEKWHKHFSHLFRESPEAELNLQGENCTPMDDPITPAEYKTAVKKLGNNKAPGVDGYPNEVWKALSLTCKNDIIDLFNRTIATGEIPEEWCTILITPIFKKGIELN